MKVRLEYKGTVIQETDARGIKDEILIGRGRQCHWQVPDEDRLVSLLHLILCRRRNSIWVIEPTPPSKNGTYFRGKRIEKLRLRPGYRVTFGACVLSMENEQAADAAKTLPELLVLSGKNRGQVHAISGPGITIGSGPSAGLVLLENLVSREHAQVTLKPDGSCWIRDLESTNGTSVNGTPLRPGQERLLKDGDRIGIAHVDLRFQDGTTRRSGRRVIQSLLVLLLTVGAATGLWRLKTSIRPADYWYREAERHIAAERFPEALKALDQAVLAAGGNKYRDKIAVLRRQAEKWAWTLSTWQRAQEMLARAEITAAAQRLGELSSRGNWDWSEDAGKKRKAFEKTKRIVDATLRAKSAVERAEGTVAEMQGAERALQAALQDVEAVALEPLTNFFAQSQACLAALQRVVANSSLLEEALNSLTNWPPDMRLVVAQLETVVHNSSGTLRTRATDLIGPVQLLERGLQQLKEMSRQARDLQFSNVLQAELRMPPQDIGILDPRVATAWSNLRNAHDNLKRQAGELRILLDRALQALRELEKIGPWERLWARQGPLSNVLACDSLTRPFSVRRQDRPIGDYDRYLGIREFYEFLEALRDQKPFEGVADDDASKTVLTLSVEAVRAAEKVCNYLGAAERKWLVAGGGSLHDTYQRLTKLLEERDRLVQSLLDFAKTASGRQLVVALGIAVRLSATSAVTFSQDESAESKCVSAFRAVTWEVRKRMERYEGLSPTEQIRLREEILRIGLPGDRDVGRMWYQKTLEGGYQTAADDSVGGRCSEGGAGLRVG